MIGTGPFHLRDLPLRAVPAGKATTVGIWQTPYPLPPQLLLCQSENKILAGYDHGTYCGPVRNKLKSMRNTCTHKKGEFEKVIQLQGELQGVLGTYGQMAGVTVTVADPASGYMHTSLIITSLIGVCGLWKHCL